MHAEPTVPSSIRGLLPRAERGTLQCCRCGQPLFGGCGAARRRVVRMVAADRGSVGAPAACSKAEHWRAYLTACFGEDTPPSMLWSPVGECELGTFKPGPCPCHSLPSWAQCEAEHLKIPSFFPLITAHHCAHCFIFISFDESFCFSYKHFSPICLFLHTFRLTHHTSCATSY